MKTLLRKKILEIRAGLSEEEVNRLSRSVFGNLMDAGLLESKTGIMAYIDFRKEVRTADIVTYVLDNGLNLSVPVCIPETGQLVAAEIAALEELSGGSYGIPEPTPEKIRITDCGTLDIVITPGAAFDRRGNRIGYGAGYYDRFFKRLGKNVQKVALAYSFQLLDRVPADACDIPVDFIVTDKEVIRCTGSAF